MAVESFISNYKILTQFFRCSSSECYLAEDTTGTAPLGIITLWPVITLTEEEKQAEFLQKARGGTVQCGDKTVLIRDAGVQDQHPYIVTQSSYEIRDLLEAQVKLLDQILQRMQKSYPGDQRVLLNTLLYAFITPAPVSEHEAVGSPVSQVEAAPSVEQNTPIPPVTPIPQLELPVSRETATPIPSVQEPMVENTATPIPSVQEPIVENIAAPLADEEMTLRASYNIPPPPVYAPVSQSEKGASQVTPLPFGALIGKYRLGRWRPRQWQIGVAVVLIVLLLAWGINTLHNTLPATSATVTIKPMSQEMRKTYTISVSAQPSSPLAVKGRGLSANSEQLVESGPATGQGHHDAVSATGTIVVSQINLTNSTGNDVLNLSIGDNNGVTATGDESVHIYTGGTVSISSQASPAGSAGNIAAHDMDGPIQIIDHYTQAVIGTAYISNPQPFSGGVDARDYTYVQQSDIDKVANALVTQLTTDTKVKVKQQVKSGELLVQDPSCSPNISPDHKPQDEAASVTVKVSLTCMALAYRNQQLQDAAAQAYNQDGTAHFGKGYNVVGATVLSKPTFVPGDSFSISVNGIWTFQYTDQSQLALKKLIAGKPTSDALQMLHTRKDIQNVTLTTDGGFGTAVPSVLPQIKLNIDKVNGLSA
jgi:VCBS repeat-containing protein